MSSAPSTKSDDSKDHPPDMAEGRRSADSGYPPSQASGSVSSGPVLCDVCIDPAMKRCLTCMASYCEIHVKDHLTSPDLDSHELQDLHHHSLCPQHHRELEFYCRTDQSAICSRCFLHDHNGHNVIEQTPEKTSSNSFRKEDIPPPGPIQFVSVQPDSVSLRWSPPEGAPGHHTFKVTWTGGQKHCNLMVTDTSLEVTELTPGEKYHFTVATLSQDGRQSTPVEGAVHTEVPPPHNLQVNVDQKSLKASVTWTKPAGVDRVTYLLEIIKSRGQQDKRTIHRDSCQYTITDLQAAYYTVNVTTVVNNGSQSQPGSTTFSTAHHLALVLLGQSGSGKSASGNTILGEDKFASERTAEQLTTQCQKAEVYFCGRQVTVIDTPDFFDEDLKEPERHIRECREMCDGSECVYLLVIQIGRFTEGERGILERLERALGRIRDRTIILFTYGDNLKSDQTIDDYINEAGEDLQRLIMECGCRYRVFNSRERDEQQVIELTQCAAELLQYHDIKAFPLGHSKHPQCVMA